MVQRRNIDVEKILSDLGPLGAFITQAHDQEQDMQGVELETRVNAVGYAQPGVEGRIARLTHRRLIQPLAQMLMETVSEQILKHDHTAPFPPCR